VYQRKISVKDQIATELNVPKHTYSYINASALGRKYKVSRQRIWQILEELGETRHKRTTKRMRSCRTCGIPISNSAINCRKHRLPRDSRKKGFNYICRVCSEYKPLEQFVKNNQSHSGYGTSCLDCRAEWQREYNKTEKGYTNRYTANKKLAQRYPERVRAYYQVHKAIKQEKLHKAPQCEDSECFNSRVLAVHTDYAQPLNVRWLCSFHSKQQQAPTTKYTPNPTEIKYRQFVQDYTNTYNIPGKWISALKIHYNEITHSTLVDAVQNYKNIAGLGRKFYIATQAFLNNILESLD